MSWDDWRRRRNAINSVLEQAEANPHADLAYESLPEVAAVFRSRTQLLLALQYDWQQVLWAQIELQSLDTHGRPIAAAEVCSKAWTSAAAQRPALRHLLDRHLDECNDARAWARQQDLLVSAGIGHSAHGRRYVSPARVA